MLTITLTATLNSKVGNNGGGGIPPTNTVSPVASGSSVIGSTLSCSTGTWTGTLPITYAYQWRRNGSNIVGETGSTYTLVSADYGQAISCEVIGTNAFGTNNAESNAITGTATAPVNTVAPVVSGSTSIGSTLSTTNGTWTSLLPITYTYQWYRGASIISGATSSTYVLVYADGGNNISCQVTATNLAGSTNASSNSLTIPLLLDTYTGAAVAYSVRKLRTAYSGNCLRVRRSSDNAESNIGFVNNALDTTSLLSFVGAGNGFVTTWYDQSTNGRNATQTTAANQPQIVSSGSLLTLTGVGSAKPILRFDGVNDNFDFSAVTAPQFTSFYPQKKSSSGSISAWFSGTVSGTPYSPVIYQTIGTYISNTITATYSTTYNNTNYILLSGYVKSNNTGFIQVNNSAITLGTTSNSSAGTFSKVCARTSPSSIFSGCDVPEMILYSSDNSANLSAINTDINNYYQIY